MPKLTTNEQNLLRAFWTNEYVDGQACPDTWTFSVTQYSELSPKSAPGVFASLSTKGLIEVMPREKGESYNSAYVTDEGHAAALEYGLIVNTGTDAEPYWKGAPRSGELVLVPAPGKGKKAKIETPEPTPEPTPAPLPPSKSSTAKAARRVIRNYLRAAMLLAMFAEAPAEVSEEEFLDASEAYDRADAALSALPGYGEAK